MSISVVERPAVVPSVSLEALPAESSEALCSAYETVKSAFAIVQESGPKNDYAPQDLGMRLSEAGVWLSTYKEQEKRDGLAIGPTAETTAIRVLAGAAHCLAVTRQLDAVSPGMERGRLKPLVHYACLFNGWSKMYALHDPRARRSHLLQATDGVLSLVERNVPEEALSRRIAGVQYELGAACVLGYGHEEGEKGLTIKGANTKADLQGIDLFVQCPDSPNEGIGVDIKASMTLVGKKCNLPKPAMWGTKNGVLVLWPGFKITDMGDGFVVAPDRAREIYSKHIGRIMRMAFHSPDVRKVRWSGIR